MRRYLPGPGDRGALLDEVFEEAFLANNSIVR